MAAAQIGMMFMTGGSSALLTGAIQQGIMQFGGQAMAQALGKELVSMVGQELIQKLGTEMGLPQSMIDAAQAAFCKECGDMQGYQRNHLEAGTIGMGNGLTKFEQMSSKVFLQHILNGFDASPAQRGNAERAFGEYYDGVSDIINQLLKKRTDESRASSASGGPNTDGKSLLVAIAIALGSVVDEKMFAMKDKTEELGNLDTAKDKEDVAGQQEFQKAYGQLTGEISALGQELKMVSEAMSSTIKSIGEASSTLARKQ
ncbi:MAG: hypothetical protein ACRBEQ_14260 [Hyphomonas sp.]